MRGVMGCFGDGLPHGSGGSEGAIEPGMTHHLHDRGNPTPFFSDQSRRRLQEFHFTGGIRAVAELVL